MASAWPRPFRAILVAAGGFAALAISDARQFPFDAGAGSVPGLAAPARFVQSAGRGAGDRRRDVGHPTFNSPHASPIAVNGGYVFVANTPADTVDVIDASSRAVVARIDVGIDPVGLAVRPDGLEVWAANHVSDSVSVIDTNPKSLTYLQVVATVQDLDRETGVTRFDEPVGVAFASDAKAYVALSSDNQVAVIDVASREAIGRLAITAQDPRALVVRDGLLYVIPFESNNQTQISGCRGRIDGELCTFDAQQHVVDNNNVLSLGIDVDIVKHPEVPDRDLYIFETANDTLVEIASTVGTLLYGLAVDSEGRVFVAQADARNDANGRAGTEKEGLAELENRAFLNRITRVDCGGGACGAPAFIELEPLPPVHPAPGRALATPFAIQVSEDDSTLVVSAAGSDKLFTVDAASGNVLGRTQVDAVPRGIALESNADGGPSRAWVLNAVANTVSQVDVSDPSTPRVVATVTLDDPTHPAVKRGRIAFNDADASTTGTFSCESCHPDGHTDQLVWVLNTPVCDRQGCTQIPPRSTMPIRGLRDTAPYHWDGIPGDPYGGVNTANTRTQVPPNCSIGDEESCTRFLVDATLRTTMCLVGECPVNDEGKAGALSGAERDDLAKFVLSVPYPPAQRRSYSNVLSDDAMTGFKRFHMHGVPDGRDRRLKHLRQLSPDAVLGEYQHARQRDGRADMARRLRSLADPAARSMERDRPQKPVRSGQRFSRTEDMGRRSRGARGLLGHGAGRQHRLLRSICPTGHPEPHVRGRPVDGGLAGRIGAVRARRRHRAPGGGGLPGRRGCDAGSAAVRRWLLCRAGRGFGIVQPGRADGARSGRPVRRHLHRASRRQRGRRPSATRHLERRADPCATGRPGIPVGVGRKHPGQRPTHPGRSDRLRQRPARAWRRALRERTAPRL